MDKKLRHAIVILCHGNIESLVELISFFDMDFTIYVHIDRKYTLSEDERNRIVSAHPLVRIFSKYRVYWGGISVLRAELFLMKRIWENENIDYLHLLSGEDYPIKSLSEIKAFFADNYGSEFLNYHRIPFRKWEEGTYRRFEIYRLNDFLSYRSEKGKRIIDRFNSFQIRHGIKRRIPDQFPVLYGGSNWMSISNTCLGYICGQHSKNKRFYRRLRYTFAPDEVYFHTLIMNSPFKEKAVDDNKRLIIWDKVGNGPLWLIEENWWDVVTSRALFARKFHPGKSEVIKEWIRKYIHRISSPEIDSNGSWCQQTLYGHTFDIDLARGIDKLCSILLVKTIYDLGCGPGWYVKFLRDRGYDAQGYDGNRNVEEMSSRFFNNGFYCQYMDLSEPVRADDHADMVLCLEVGEHIPADKENIFLDNLACNSGKYLLLSWAIPHQKGDGHVNCHTNQYIIDRMKSRNFRINVPVSILLRESSGLPWFKSTIMFFEKTDDNR